jgi:hypothetical protein
VVAARVATASLPNIFRSFVVVNNISSPWALVVPIIKLVYLLRLFPLARDNNNAAAWEEKSFGLSPLLADNTRVVASIKHFNLERFILFVLCGTTRYQRRFAY